MVICEDGTPCSAGGDFSVLAYGFIDEKSDWVRSDYPCMDRKSLDRCFATFDDGNNVHDGYAIFVYENYEYSPWRGSSHCKICVKTEDSKGNLVRGRKGWGGIVLIPSKRLFNRYYLFPNLMGHLIEAHNYLPPPDLIDALVSFEPDPTWDTKSLEHKLFHAPFSIR
jgi:hypothetical protein